MQRGWNLLQTFCRASYRQETGLTRAFYDFAVYIHAVCDLPCAGLLCCCSEYLDRLEKWANGSLVEFNKGKCQFLHLGRSNLVQQYKQGTDYSKSSFAETLEVLVDVVV